LEKKLIATVTAKSNSMYSPAHYKEDRDHLIRDLITHSNFATMLSHPQGELTISHLPFIFNGGNLMSHLARVNSHWKIWEKNPELTLIFNGPHGYISPKWYQKDPENVPTWNYVAVHVTGRAVIEKDPALVQAKMRTMAESFEKQNSTDWKLPESGLENLYKQIVVFEVQDLKFEAKFKLSQNQIPANRDNVISELEKINPRLAQIMKNT
jgi:transcriptional regulator